ncbi:hypothetical protein IAQ61_007912 [Plenodomus lingam]|uniref:uncharacterized protein n=1 Tax=Leptosphaeria maculans TaxID=5022 RepID=UPI00332FABF8|nr:hypothetical protein IAQ61_007912 [Plenodomus lingam]
MKIITQVPVPQSTIKQGHYPQFFGNIYHTLLAVNPTRKKRTRLFRYLPTTPHRFTGYSNYDGPAPTPHVPIHPAHSSSPLPRLSHPNNTRPNTHPPVTIGAIPNITIPSLLPQACNPHPSAATLSHKHIPAAHTVRIRDISDLAYEPVSYTATTEFSRCCSAAASGFAVEYLGGDGAVGWKGGCLA